MMSSSRTSRLRHCATSPERRRLNGAPLPDGDGASPFSQGVAGLGRNIGSVAPGATVTITYRTRAGRAVRAGAVRPRARVSSRESLVPVPGKRAPAADARAAAAQDRRHPGRGRSRRPRVRRPAGRVVTVARRGSAGAGAGVRVRPALPRPLPVDPRRGRVVPSRGRAAQRRGLALARDRARRVGAAQPPRRP